MNKETDDAEDLPLPSWLRWPPNSCETCTFWQQETDYSGMCENQKSTHAGDHTDSRFRCQDFYRKA